MQRVRDHKSRTVEERVPVIRDWFLRLDALQRKRSINGKCRVSPENTYAADEFSIVIKHKAETSYNIRGAECNHVKELQDLASRAASGILTVRYRGDPVGKLHIIFPLAPKKIYAFNNEGEKYLKD